jgi:protein TonB
MPGYTGYHRTKKGWSATTITVVVLIHLLLIYGLYRLSQSEYVRTLINVTKLVAVPEPEKPPEQPPPEQPPEPTPEPAPLQEPTPAVKESPPEPVEPAAPEDQSATASEGDSASAPLVDSTPFAIGKKGDGFSGYESILTASIQAVYQQPADLSDTVNYAVLCQLVLDEEGYVLTYKLLNSSGNAVFDRSAQQALSRLRQVRPPPPGMSPTVVVKFFPP